MKQTAKTVTLKIIILSILAFGVPSYAADLKAELVGNWFSQCDPEVGDKESATTIFNADGTWRTVEMVFLDSNCQTLHQIATFKGTYSLSENVLTLSFDSDWTMTPLTQERADFLNLEGICGITTWAVLETPRVWESPTCQLPPGHVMDSRIQIIVEKGVAYLIESVEAAPGVVLTFKSKKLASGS